MKLLYFANDNEIFSGILKVASMTDHEQKQFVSKSKETKLHTNVTRLAQDLAIIKIAILSFVAKPVNVPFVNHK